MAVVVIALLPCVLVAFYNTGFQANFTLVEEVGDLYPEGWRGGIMSLAGVEADQDSLVSNLLHGSLWFIPVWLVSLGAAFFWEALFAVVRRRDMSEAVFVTSLMFALILPPAIPLWQAALGISFGTVFGKEVFGGLGMNILNPALVGRAFLFFAYPSGSVGEGIWVPVDGITRATPLLEFVQAGETTVTWREAFLGLTPGSMGETSTLACLVGAAILVFAGVALWRIMVSVVAGAVGLALILNGIGSEEVLMFQMGPHWHLVLGGLAFGAVFMATDPVTSARTDKGQVIYGLLIGTLTVLVRVVNPAYVEGIMLAILFANVFAPTIDRVVIRGNIRRRRQRDAV
jgi:Na+-transporting NADH:ubiquinone oxidoreductase subunit B